MWVINNIVIIAKCKMPTDPRFQVCLPLTLSLTCCPATGRSLTAHSYSQAVSTLVFRLLCSSVGFPCGSAGNEPACNSRETWVWSLGWEDPLKKGKATHPSVLAWRIPWTIYIVHGVAKSQTRLSDFHFLFSLKCLFKSVVLLSTYYWVSRI